MDGPFLASASAHLLASLKQWQIFTWGIRPARVLQFIIREEWLRLQVESLVIQSNTTAASILISTATVFRAKHKVNPSLKAHSSASTLVAYPMFLVKPFLPDVSGKAFNPLLLWIHRFQISRGKYKFQGTSPSWREVSSRFLVNQSQRSR